MYNYMELCVTNIRDEPNWNKNITPRGNSRRVDFFPSVKKVLKSGLRVTEHTSCVKDACRRSCRWPTYVYEMVLLKWILVIRVVVLISSFLVKSCAVFFFFVLCTPAQLIVIPGTHFMRLISRAEIVMFTTAPYYFRTILWPYLGEHKNKFTPRLGEALSSRTGLSVKGGKIVTCLDNAHAHAGRDSLDGLLNSLRSQQVLSWSRNSSCLEVTRMFVTAFTRACHSFLLSPRSPIVFTQDTVTRWAASKWKN